MTMVTLVDLITIVLNPGYALCPSDQQHLMLIAWGSILAAGLRR